MLTSNVNIRILMPFWRTALLDGELRLDGSRLLDSMRDYELRLGLMYKEGDVKTDEVADIHSATICWRQELSEMYAGAYTRIDFVVPFWSVLTLNGDALLDDGTSLDECRVDTKTAVSVHLQENMTTETVENVMCITRRNLAYLDGSLKLDGTRQLNSLYEKEAI
jgi:hypothetical protein